MSPSRLSVFFVTGAPGCGKSSLVQVWAKILSANGCEITIIDPDAYKKVSGNSDHEESIKRATQLYFQAVAKGSGVIFHQGTGSWLPYYDDLVRRTKEVSCDARIGIIRVEVCIESCLKRIEDRRVRTGQEVDATAAIHRYYGSQQCLAQLRQRAEVFMAFENEERSQGTELVIQRSFVPRQRLLSNTTEKEE